MMVIVSLALFGSVTSCGCCGYCLSVSFHVAVSGLLVCWCDFCFIAVIVIVI